MTGAEVRKGTATLGPTVVQARNRLWASQTQSSQNPKKQVMLFLLFENKEVTERLRHFSPISWCVSSNPLFRYRLSDYWIDPLETVKRDAQELPLLLPACTGLDMASQDLLGDTRKPVQGPEAWLERLPAMGPGVSSPHLCIPPPQALVR